MHTTLHKRVASLANTRPLRTERLHTISTPCKCQQPKQSTAVENGQRCAKCLGVITH